MTVPATIPAIEVVHRTSLTLNDDFVKQVMADQYIVVGQALSAELRITHTRKWGSQVLDRELQCCFDVQADPDSWLIGGMRRCYFMAKVSTQGYYAGNQLFADAHHEQENDQLSFPLLLFPQRSGHLVLPSVKIWAVPADLAETASLAGPSKARPLSCETDNTTETKTVLAIPNLGSTTMCLDTGKTGNAAWLVESTPRGV